MPQELTCRPRVTERAGRARSIAVGPHRVTADEPVPVGGDVGPNPFEFVLAGLGTCGSMTLRMDADRHGWPLRDVRVRPRSDGPAVVEVSWRGTSTTSSDAGSCPFRALSRSPAAELGGADHHRVRPDRQTAEAADTMQNQRQPARCSAGPPQPHPLEGRRP
ncbi:OsmC family protein [Streptomyces sp. 142MFCol3.1]|uniref:OsmC family protein n=1 Tax=Streptomyces sp. 142MFCol3.1 TaxID=1172179 RepID=UPI001F43EEFA|nr:OsmC family protein [Streptomyces sp. 142MFCol3.1]